jgi:hypothetical protein
MANPGIASLIDVVDHPGSRTLNGRPLVPSSEAVTGYNVPQRLVASAVWELPHGNPFRSWLRAALQWTQSRVAALIASAKAGSMKNKDVRTNGHYWFDTSFFSKPRSELPRKLSSEYHHRSWSEQLGHWRRKTHRFARVDCSAVSRRCVQRVQSRKHLCA